MNALVRSKRWPLLALLAAVAASGAVCTCQRAENIEAKKRLSKPAPPDPHVKAADDKIDVDKLTDPVVMERVVRMDGSEIAARLKSFSFASTGELTFSRGDDGSIGKVRSFEKTKLVQDPRGNFAVDVTTGDQSEMKLAYVNDVFYLKNNNGKWRIDRDPQGERNQYRSDALGVWKGFYDLVGHALIVEKVGASKHDGREVMRYKLSLPDQSASAKAAGASVPQLPVGPDGGPADETAPAHLKRMKDRMGKWRERSKPAGGFGELWVDMDAGVITYVKFTGAMVVADGPDPSRLEVKIDASTTEVGKDENIPVPKDAIEEIVRKKMPVQPRALLEEENIVPPLPRDAGPGGNAGIRKPPPKPAGDLPDDDGEEAAPAGKPH
ncbi:MAG TPA: hypothetical protein VGO62_20045 [Myxococcota bacterium]